jgi:uncharacterized protein YpbB
MDDTLENENCEYDSWLRSILSVCYKATKSLICKAMKSWKEMLASFTMQWLALRRQMKPNTFILKIILNEDNYVITFATALPTNQPSCVEIRQYVVRETHATHRKIKKTPIKYR